MKDLTFYDRFAASRMLSDLLQTTDPEAVDEFRARRLARDASGSRADLARLRQLLEEAYDTICDPTPDKWDRLHLAWQAACSHERGELAPFLEDAVDVSRPEDAELQQHKQPAPFVAPVVVPRVVSPERPLSSAWVATNAPAAEQHAAALPVPTSSGQSSNVDETVYGPSPLIFEDPLPFAAGAAAPPPSIGDDLEPHEDVGATSAMRTIPREVKPFDQASSRRPMDLDVYAAICFHTKGASVDRRAEVHRHYGVDGEQARSELDRRFSTLFAQHSELATAFGELLAQLNESAGEQ